MIITTSWDDGHQLDIRLANLLNKYNLKGTFYIAKDYLPERMSDEMIRQLAEEHEIGAHTITHPILTHIPLDEAEQEIRHSKSWLEDLLGQAINSFCYPTGAQNQDLQDIVKSAGYLMGRGVDGYFLQPSQRFNLETTIHIYPFPLRPLPNYPIWRGISNRLQPIRMALPHIRRLSLPISSIQSWESLAIALLQKAAEQDTVWHLWGHSWEIEKFQMWDALENVLDAASQYQAQHLTNTQLVQQLLETAE